MGQVERLKFGCSALGGRSVRGHPEGHLEVHPGQGTGNYSTVPGQGAETLGREETSLVEEGTACHRTDRGQAQAQAQVQAPGHPGPNLPFAGGNNQNRELQERVVDSEGLGGLAGRLQGELEPTNAG